MTHDEEPDDIDIQRARLAGRVEAESQQIVRDEQRAAWLKKTGAIVAVAAVILLVWQPWNANARQAQTASDAYYAAETALSQCTARSTSSTVANCWDTFSGSLSAIAWPGALTSDSTDLIGDVNAVANALRGQGSYESTLLAEKNAEDRLTTDMTPLTNGK